MAKYRELESLRLFREYIFEKIIEDFLNHKYDQHQAQLDSREINYLEERLGRFAHSRRSLTPSFNNPTKPLSIPNKSFNNSNESSNKPKPDKPTTYKVDYGDKIIDYPIHYVEDIEITEFEKTKRNAKINDESLNPENFEELMKIMLQH